MTEEPAGTHAAGGIWIRHAAAVVFFAALACAFSYPLVLNLATHIAGPPGDNFTFVWNFWWFRFAMASGASVFDCPYLFAPFGVSLVLTTHTALESVAGATLLRPLPVVSAHNIVLLAGLAANGIAAYSLAYTHVRRTMPAMLAGVIYCTSAYIGLHLLGHFNLVHAWVLPVAALAWTTFVARPSLLRASMVAIAFAAALYSDYYYFVYATLFAGLWLAVTEWSPSIAFGASRSRWAEAIVVALAALVALTIAAIALSGGWDFSIGRYRLSMRGIRNPTTGLWMLFLLWVALRTRITFRRRHDSTLPGVLRYGGWTIVLGGVLALPVLISAVSLFAAGDYVPPRVLWRSAPGGIDVVGLVAGNPMHAAYGPLTTAVFGRFDIGLIDQSGWIGIVPIAIAVALATARPHVRFEYRRWILIAAFFLIWSLGPFLQIAGRATGILLPQFFTRFVPLLSNARIPGRAFVMVMLAASLLSALAVVELRWHRRTIALLIAVALLDGLVAPFPLSAVPAGGPIERYLAKDSKAGSVLLMPTGYQDGFEEVGRFNARALAYQMHHHRPIVGGYISRVPDRIKTSYRDRPAIAALIALSASNPSPTPAALPEDMGQLLAEDGIAFVVLSRGVDVALPDRKELALRGLTFLLADGDRELYVVGDR
jgi:hypothetical protein